jgi:hypothetical protein
MMVRMTASACPTTRPDERTRIRLTRAYVHAAAIAALQLNLPLSWEVHQVESDLIHRAVRGGSVTMGHE